MSRPQPPDILGAVLGTPESVIAAGLRYDYNQIDADHRAAVRDAAIAIVRSGRKAQESLIDIGQRLNAAKGLLPHGQFSDWCQVEFDMSQRTAQRMMAVAETFGGKSDTVSLLSDSALYLLAGPSVPEEARQEVIAEAQAAGASPTKAQVQAVIDKHKPAPASYASVWEIQSKVSAVIAQKWPNDRYYDVWIRAMRSAAKTTGSAFMHAIEEALEQAGIEYRKRDLVQAVNNVADTLEQDLKRRQAAPAPPAAAPAPATTLDIPIKRAAAPVTPADAGPTPPTYDDLCKLIAARPNLKASDLRSAIRQRRGHWLFDTIMASAETAHPGAWSQTRVVQAMMAVADQLDQSAAMRSRLLALLGRMMAVADQLDQSAAPDDPGFDAMRQAAAAIDDTAAASDAGPDTAGKLLMDWTDEDWAQWQANQIHARRKADEAATFAEARVHLGDALASLKAAKSALGGWHDELANMIDEIAAHVSHAIRELD